MLLFRSGRYGTLVTTSLTKLLKLTGLNWYCIRKFTGKLMTSSFVN